MYEVPEDDKVVLYALFLHFHWVLALVAVAMLLFSRPHLYRITLIKAFPGKVKIMPSARVNCVNKL